MWSFHTHRRKTTTSTPIFLLFPTSSLYEDVGRTKVDMFINFCNLLVQTTLILEFFFHSLSWCTEERRMRKKTMIFESLTLETCQREEKRREKICLKHTFFKSVDFNQVCLKYPKFTHSHNCISFWNQ
ncbi:hypothetical protein ACP275_08G248700 [Erythranthe tilingii]